MLKGLLLWKKNLLLNEIFPLDTMHDQKIIRSELSAGTLSLYFEDLRFDEPHSLETTLCYNQMRKQTLSLFEYWQCTQGQGIFSPGKAVCW